MNRSTTNMASSGLSIAFLGLALLGGAEPAFGATLHVNPVSLTLTDRAANGLISLANDGSEPARLQITAFTWDEAPDGTMKLEPTDDLLIFPPLATIAAGAKRGIRIATTVHAGATERAYRIYVEELPNDDLAPTDNQIRIRSRFGIPIFVSPKRPSAGLELGAPSVERGHVSFSVGNQGNAHTRLKRVMVRGLDGSGTPVFEQELKGWYLLSGGLRSYDLSLDAAACKKASTVEIEVSSATGTLKGEPVRIAAGCGG